MNCYWEQYNTVQTKSAIGTDCVKTLPKTEVREVMQNLESIDWSTCVKFYVGAHFSTLFYTLSTIINVFTQPGHEADEFAGLKVRCERGAEVRERDYSIGAC